MREVVEKATRRLEEVAGGARTRRRAVGDPEARSAVHRARPPWPGLECLHAAPGPGVTASAARDLWDPGGRLSCRDHLWLTEASGQSLPATRRGDESAVPATVARADRAFHLVDNTRGEPPFWSAAEVQKADLKWTVEEATAKQVRLRLNGSVLLATSADAKKAERGFKAQVLGYREYDRTAEGHRAFRRGGPGRPVGQKQPDAGSACGTATVAV